MPAATMAKVAVSCMAVALSAANGGVRTDAPWREVEYPAAADGDGDRAAPSRLEAARAGESAFVLVGEAMLPTGAAFTIEAAFAGGTGRAARVERLSAAPDGSAIQLGARARAGADKVGAWLPFTVACLGGDLRVTAAGEVLSAGPVPPDASGCTLSWAGPVGLRGVRIASRASPPGDAAFQPADLLALANRPTRNGRLEADGAPAIDAAALPQGAVEVDGVPFIVGPGALDVSASMRDLREPLRAKHTYLSGEAVAGGRKAGTRLVTDVPPGWYSAVHLLAFARDLPGAVPRMTVRLGIFGGASGILEDAVVAVPGLVASGKADGPAGGIPIALADGGQGMLYHLTVPFPQSGNLWEFASAGRRLDLEFTRDVRVHVTCPDPYEFAEVPAGPPSSAVVLAATLERAPVEAGYTTGQSGNIFEPGQRPVFTVALTNRTAAVVEGRVTLRCAGPGTGAGAETSLPVREWRASKPFRLQPGRAASLALAANVPSGLKGWFDAALAIETGGRVVQKRRTSFAVLPEGRPEAGDASPFGVWCFFRAHAMFDRMEEQADIIRKGGWRWTYGGSPLTYDQTYNPRKRPADELAAEIREVYTRIQSQYGFTWTLNSPAHAYQRGEGWFDADAFEKEVVPELAEWKTRGLDPTYKVLHESRSSSALLLRLSEFLGGSPYGMPDAETQMLEKQVENVRRYCLALKAAHPEARIVLINDYPAVAVEYLRRRFPPEAFDVIGLEGAMFMLEPERPLNWLCLLGNMEQMRRAQAAFGYDKPVWTTEALYHATNPGNLTLHKQAVITVREAMLGLANGIERMAAAGILADSSDDYYWSNWGASGYCFRDPDLNPKPSFSAYAWLIRALDGAAFAGDLDTGSASLHLLDFRRPDGTHVYPLWTVRGRQKVTLAVAGGQPVVHDVFGNRLPARVAGERLTLEAGDSPVYVSGAEIGGAAERTPIDAPPPEGTPLLAFADAALAVREEPSAILEGNWQLPRIAGRFEKAVVSEEGNPVLKLRLLPDDDERTLLPRYAELVLENPVALDDARGGLLRARVGGGASWAQVIFELTDAKGRVWTSCGSQNTGSPNGVDPKGDSFVCFDGWGTVEVELPAQYGGADQFVVTPRRYLWWPTNTPEAPERQKAYEGQLAEYRAARATYEAARAQHQEALRRHEAAVKQAAAAGQKPPPTPPAPPPEPREPRPPQEDGLVPADYPLRLTKVIVAMAPHILYVNREVPLAAPEILLDRLVWAPPQEEQAP